MGELPITKFVTVTISRDTARVTEESFNIPLIAGDNGAFADRTTVATKSEYAALYDAADPEYIAAEAVFDQNPRIYEVKFGKLTPKVAQITTLTFSADLITGNKINGKINGVALTETDWAVSHDSTMTTIAGKINALSSVAAVVTGGPGSRVITITSEVAGTAFTATNFLVTLGATQATCAIVTGTPNHGIKEDFDEIVTEDNDWYGLIYCERTKSFVQDAAAWIQSKEKMFITASNDATILASTTTDIAALLSASNYSRIASLFSDDVDNYPEAAWIGKCFPYDPGTIIWANKSLEGITPDTITEAQCLEAQGKNCNVFVTVGGANVTLNGTMANGDWMDIQPFVDWLQARIRETIWDAIVSNAKKIPYTDDGIAVMRNGLVGVLQGAEDDGKLSTDPKYTISVPKASSVSQADRDDRELNNIEFTCQYSGAIQKVNIIGTLEF